MDFGIFSTRGNTQFVFFFFFFLEYDIVEVGNGCGIKNNFF